VRGLVGIVGVVAGACSYTPRQVDVEPADASPLEPDGLFVLPDAPPDAMPGAPDGMPDAVPVTCPTNYNQTLDGHRYRAGSGTWYEAVARCEADGTHLVVVGSFVEGGFVDLLTSGHAWVGMSDHAQEGTFRWITDGDQVTLGWQFGEPNNAGNNEDCGTVVPGLPPAFNDEDCDLTLDYVCECDGDTMPATPYWCETDIDTACEDCNDDCTDDDEQCNNHQCG
jgi:hypothetical protein